LTVGLYAGQRQYLYFERFWKWTISIKWKSLLMNDYKGTIINAVNNGADCFELRSTTAIFKAKGLSQSDAYNILVEVRAMFADEDETKEDVILELMDFVVGYCQDRFLIWDSSELDIYSRAVKFSVHDFIDKQRNFNIRI
jgi:hypothetical protein